MLDAVQYDSKFQGDPVLSIRGRLFPPRKTKQSKVALNPVRYLLESL
jgi:hypothetical protein